MKRSMACAFAVSAITCHDDLSWMGRAAMELTFGLQLLTTRWGRPEVVICVTPPLLAAAMSAIRARLTWRRPAFGILVQDLYSRGVAETGAAVGLSARAVRVVESAAIRLADGVAVIHAGFSDGSRRTSRRRRAADSRDPELDSCRPAGSVGQRGFS